MPLSKKFKKTKISKKLINKNHLVGPPFLFVFMMHTSIFASLFGFFVLLVSVVFLRNVPSSPLTKTYSTLRFRLIFCVSPARWTQGRVQSLNRFIFLSLDSCLFIFLSLNSLVFVESIPPCQASCRNHLLFPSGERSFDEIWHCSAHY